MSFVRSKVGGAACVPALLRLLGTSGGYAATGAANAIPAPGAKRGMIR